MTEETTIVEVDVDESKALHGEPIPEIVAPVVKHDVNDVDASWDGKGSLDDHRQKVLQSVKQPGFGDAGKVKADG